MPCIPGIFQSVTTKFEITILSVYGKAVFPSSASWVLLKPRSRSKFLMIRLIVEKSSTIRILISVFKSSSKKPSIHDLQLHLARLLNTLNTSYSIHYCCIFTYLAKHSCAILRDAWLDCVFDLPSGLAHRKYFTYFS